MTNREIWNTLNNAASTVYDNNEAGAVCRLLCEEVLGMRYIDIFSEPSTISGIGKEKLDELCSQILSMRPVQYIIGHTTFCGQELNVAEGVLIPRPETEELVRLIVSHHAGTSPAIIDIGTGSGCIAVSLATLLPSATVTAVDISPAALRTASENAQRCGVSVRTIPMDILNENFDGQYDIIVSNPPYVAMSESGTMRENVLRYEPHDALFVPDSDPLLFYRTIASKGRKALRPGGMVYFEINERFAEQTVRMLGQEGYSGAIVQNDLFDKPRIVYAWLKE